MSTSAVSEPAAPPETPSVTASSARAVLLNRALLLLGFIGLFIAGYLSYVKAARMLPMCGVEGGCMAVTDHPSAYWFGIPVAYYGLMGYVAIVGLAALREVLGRELSRFLVGLGLLVSTFGFFASAYLQYTALMVIHEACKWCIGSAITMLLTFIGHVLLFGLASDATNPRFRARPLAIPVLVGGLALTGAAIAFTPKADATGPRVIDAKISSESELVPPDANSLGDEGAKLTIVEFADFCCPTCRQLGMSSRELVKKYPGKVRFVFRHFPLLGIPGHEMAFPLAIASEFAAKNGKFWAFHEAAMTAPQVPKSYDEVLTLARNVGLDDLALAKIIKLDPSDSYERVYRDYTEAIKLNVRGTPSFFVMVKGGPVKQVRFSALPSELETGQFAGYVH